MGTPIRLKALLRQRHWQVHATFQTEYDRIAKTIDPSLVGTAPSRAQFHRWLSGDLKGLPYPHHCRILEAMFPGHTADQLFAPADDPSAPSTAGDGVDQAGTAAAAPIPPTGPPGTWDLTTPPVPVDAPGDIDEETAPVVAGGVNYRARETDLDERVAASHQEWLAIRRRLGQHRAALTKHVLNLYPDDVRLGDTGLLMPPQWRLSEPVDLTTIDLTWTEAPPPAVTGQHQETRALRPLAAPGQPYSRYSRAMRDLDRPRLFENRIAYRLLDADWTSSAAGGRLTLGNMCYFDMIDLGETLAHELAQAATTPDGQLHPDRITWDALPYRRMVRDPFDLAAYPLMLSISTLTVRRSRAGTTFQLLRRSPAKVAIAGGMLSVMPTGVFQPASVLPAPASPDFNLWRNMMREYSEEFLGNPEHDGDGPPIDYATTEPFRTMDAARRDGKIKVWCLGIGLDALNYVADVLTVAVFDDDIFDHLFDGMADHNDEGTIITTDHQRRAFTFNRNTVNHLLTTENIAPSGAACLHLSFDFELLISEG